LSLLLINPGQVARGLSELGVLRSECFFAYRDCSLVETFGLIVSAFSIVKDIEIVAADSPTAFVDDTPTATFVRQVLGAVAQLDKAMTVAKLRGARERKRRENGWCEGGSPLHVKYPEPSAWPSDCTGPTPSRVSDAL
jgi:hypothetical protein